MSWPIDGAQLTRSCKRTPGSWTAWPEADKCVCRVALRAKTLNHEVQSSLLDARVFPSRGAILVIPRSVTGVPSPVGVWQSPEEGVWPAGSGSNPCLSAPRDSLSVCSCSGGQSPGNSGRRCCTSETRCLVLWKMAFRMFYLEADCEEYKVHVWQGDGEPGDQLVLQGRHSTSQ